MDDFIETFDRSVLNSYFEIEQNIFDSNFTDIGALVIALKMLFQEDLKTEENFYYKRVGIGAGSHILCKITN